MKILLIHFLATLMLLAINRICTAQSSIHGIVVDSAGKPLDGASVLLQQFKDSLLVKGSITKKDGKYLFEHLSPGNYILVTSYEGFKDAYSQPLRVTSDGNMAVPPVKIMEKVLSLSGVTLVAKKPMFEQKLDRMIINVANSITNTGSTALEVLMRSPGVTVNQQNRTLSMNGKEGVVVILNGRINRMPADALVQLLAGMSAANIEKIELITTPPANFDAEGNAGFINIVMKKNVLFGTNGAFAVTAGYGFSGGPVTGGNINFNHRKNKWNLYGDYAFIRSQPNSYGKLYRKVMNGSKTIENVMDTKRDDFNRNHNARVGVDYEFDQKNIVGVLVSGFSNLYGMEAVNTSNIVINGLLDTTIIINNPERHPLDNYSINANFLHRFKTDQQLSINADYIYFKDANTLSYLNNFYNKTGNFLYREKTRSNKETPISFRVVSADYSAKLAKNIDMEAGVKGTLSDFVNDVRVEREVQNSWAIDSTFTSKYDLNESIFAGYTSFSMKLGPKTTSKAGLRYEYTNSNLGTQTTKNIVDRHYGNWFPSVFISHTVSDDNSINISYNRRITRPTFNDMAPFVYFVDPNTIFSGNPALQPSTANQAKFDYLLKRFVFSISYTHEKGTITNFAPRIDPASNRQTLVAENQKNKKIAALNISLPFTIATWWTMQNTFSAEWLQLNAIYKGAPLRVMQNNFTINSTQSVTLPRNYGFEVSGNYQSGGLFGIYKMASMTSLNLGVQKKLGTKGGTLSLNVTNFSGPPHLKAGVDAPEHNLVTDADFRFIVTTCKLTYTLKFGSAKVKENRVRATGAEAERNRVLTN